jgi:hypothetical protein
VPKLFGGKVSKKVLVELDSTENLFNTFDWHSYENFLKKDEASVAKQRAWNHLKNANIFE